MRKQLYSFVIFNILVIAIICLSACGFLPQHYEYYIGKDSHKVFGNGEYQIMATRNIDGNKEYSLYNMKYKETIIESLVCYKKVQSYIYFYGYGNSEIFVSLNTEDNSIIYFSVDGTDKLIYYKRMVEDNVLKVINSFENFDEMGRKIFLELKQENSDDG